MQSCGTNGNANSTTYTRFIPKSTKPAKSYTPPSGKPYYGTGLSANVRATSIGPVNSALYGDRLKSYCQYNESALNNARHRVKADEIHRNLRKGLEDEATEADEDWDDCNSVTLVVSQSRWQTRDTRIKYTGSLDGAKRDYFVLEDIDDRSDMTSLSEPIDGYCYLCTTQEEHRSHLKSEKKVRGQPLKPYDNPVKPEFLPRRPLPAASNSDVRPGKNDVIYKVVVKTGNYADCGTNAQVTLRMFGAETRQKTSKLLLRKPGNKFMFMRGSANTFSLVAPNIDDIVSIEVETDGYDKSQSWLLHSVNITNMKTKRSFYFPCSDWLSLYHEGETLVRTLAVAEKEEIVREYEVSIMTGNLKHSGTDSKVYLTLVGTRGRRSKKFLLTKSDEERCFKRGSIDHFKLKNADIGTLSKIRIEHNDRGKSRRWLLLLVLIKDLYRKTQHFFYCNQWLVNEDGNATWREINASKVPDGFVLGSSSFGQEGAEVLYEISVSTGDIALAGTDANVLIQLYGDSMRSDQINLSNIRGNYEDPFERNQTDVFQLKAKNVGNIKKIRIGHDDSGMAAGWYLDKVLVRKFIEVKTRVPVKDDERDQGKKSQKSKQKGTSSSEESETEKEDNSITEKQSKRDSLAGSQRRSGKKEPKRSFASSEIHSVTKKLIMNPSVSDSSLSSSDDDDDDDKNKTKRDKKRKERKSENQKKRKEKSDDLSDLDEISQLSSDDTSVWDSEELNPTDEQMMEALRLKREHDALANTMEKVEAKVEEYTFICQQWFATNEGDRKTERILTVSDRKDYTRSSDKDSDDESSDNDNDKW